ncbi:DUF488 domain-containing protein [Aestuariibaculum sp. M13]|uniref:DUF488 domain-containing protein n=1 Tax=Aestuariibaculum sp. M13 TaxID=2967132 RepID=UPI002159F258|nr:DUF488 domain-containing protein [Aestuariibaculum sp. M13]MCR8667078.1 DUF488 domain-containing protein [Aestuariibaculum sp. M13]
MKGMYYRRKVVLALLQAFNNGKLEKLSLQKLLFLLTREQANKSYDFVPYKFGCFSFQANADLRTLTKYNLVKDSDNNWECIDDLDYFNALKQEDKAAILCVKEKFSNLNSKELIQYTYQNYPFYATKSTIVKEVLNDEELEKVAAQKRIGTDTVLFTIGYEGTSLETYINKLILNDVKVLCDVRKNSFSMKYGFSKSQLKTACEGVGIEFLHMPEVGIKSEKRQVLNCQADYDALFVDYKKTVLHNETEKQYEILKLLKNKGRIALTCFEKNIHQCHRKHLANSIKHLEGFNYIVKHI